MTAKRTFTPDNFEEAFLYGCGNDSLTPVTPDDETQIAEVCQSLAQHDHTPMAQTTEELKSAIRQWAAKWNNCIQGGTE